MKAPIQSLLVLSLSAQLFACGDAATFNQCLTLEMEIEEDTTLSGCVLAPRGIDVRGDHLVTVLPGTTITFGENTAFHLYEGGRLNATGNEEAPILFTGQESVPSYWAGVKISQSNSLDNQLHWVTIEDAGQSASAQADGTSSALELHSFYEETVRLSMTYSTVRGSAEYGIRLGANVVLDEFHSNVITQNRFTGLATISSIAQLNNGNDFTGNENDVISLVQREMVEPITWPSLEGVTLLVQEYIIVDGENENRGALTIEPGARIQFEQDMGIVAWRGGSLNAMGDEEAPIIFEGKEATPGYWSGLVFNSSNSVDNVLQNVTVAHAGGERAHYAETNELAALIINPRMSPTRVAFDNVSVIDSGAMGLHIVTDKEEAMLSCSNNDGFDCP